jgi:hypothetical protein
MTYRKVQGAGYRVQGKRNGARYTAHGAGFREKRKMTSDRINRIDRFFNSSFRKKVLQANRLTGHCRPAEEELALSPPGVLVFRSLPESGKEILHNPVDPV